MSAFLEWIGKWRIGDLASIAGLLASVVGFVLAIRAAGRARTAAERAADAAGEARDSMIKNTAIVTCSQAVSIMDEIKRLHRSSQWALLPDRYAALKTLLITLRTSDPRLSDEQRRGLVGAIRQFTEMENQVEQALESKSEQVGSVAQFNKIVSAQVDKLHEILMSLQQEIRIRSDG